MHPICTTAMRTASVSFHPVAFGALAITDTMIGQVAIGRNPLRVAARERETRRFRKVTVSYNSSLILSFTASRRCCLQPKYIKCAAAHFAEDFKAGAKTEDTSSSSERCVGTRLKILLC